MAKKKRFSLQDLKPASYNPRSINERARKGLHRSLEKFGDLSGITFNVGTGNLVTGHQRIEELTKLYGNLEIPEAPAVARGKESWATFTDPDGRSWKVRFINESLDWEMEANIVANSPSLSGVFTQDVVSMLDHLKVVSPDEFDVLALQDIYELPIAGITDTAPAESGAELKPDDEKPDAGGEELVTINLLVTEGERSVVYKAINQVRDTVKGASTIGKALAYVAQYYTENHE